MPPDAKVSTTLVVPEDLADGSVADFERRLHEALEDSPSGLLLDCRELTLVSSTHVGLLWRAYRTCQETGADIALTAASQGLIRVLRVLDLEELFTVHGNGGACAGNMIPDATAPESSSDYTDQFQVDSDSLDSCLRRFLHFLHGIDMPEMTAFELHTVFYEIAQNIIQHSGLTRVDHVYVTVRLGAGRLELSFADRGRPFDATAGTPQPDVATMAQNKRVRGFGLLMARRLSDEMTYSRRGDTTNVLTTTKTWSVAR